MTITTSVPLASAFADKRVTVQATDVELAFDLQEGKHAVTTARVAIGYMNNPDKTPLTAQLTFWYKWEEENNILYVYANNCISKHSSCLEAWVGDAEFCVQHTYDNDHHLCEPNAFINYDAPYAVELRKQFEATVRAANDRFIEEARKLDCRVVVRTALPELTPEEYERCSIVLHQGKFHSMYDPSATYTPEHTVLELKSTYVGKEPVSVGALFLNVRGSSDDTTYTDKSGKKSGESWITVWKRECGPGSNPLCTSSGFWTDKDGNVLRDGNPPTENPWLEEDTPIGGCKGDIVGGHVVCWNGTSDITRSRTPPVGGTVYIVPICSRHNVKNSGANSRSYMQARVATDALRLQYKV